MKNTISGTHIYTDRHIYIKSVKQNKAFLSKAQFFPITSHKINNQYEIRICDCFFVLTVENSAYNPVKNNTADVIHFNTCR